MSVQSNTYVLYGVRLPYKRDILYDIVEPYLDNAFKPEFNLKDGITVLDDGMNGKYLIIGHVIAKTRDGRGFPDSVIIDRTPPISIQEEILSLAVKLGFDPDATLDWIVVTHYR